MTKEQEKKLREISLEELNKMTLSSFNGDYGYLGGEIARDTGQIHSLSKDIDILNKRIESIKKARQGYVMTEKHRLSVQKDEEWIDNIRKARQEQIIQQCDMDGNVIKEWPSYKVIEDNTSFTKSSIYKAVKGKKKRGNPNESYGYIWKSKQLNK